MAGITGSAAAFPSCGGLRVLIYKRDRLEGDLRSSVLEGRGWGRLKN